VQEFFLKDSLEKLWPNIRRVDFKSVSYLQLQQCCHAYIKLKSLDHVSFNTPHLKASSNAAKELQLLVLTKFPFLEYATCHVLYHADAAADLPQDAFLKEFPLKA
jgi:hypothetical protein